MPIADEKRMGVPEDFVQVLESSKSPGELVYTLQSILGAEVNVKGLIDETGELVEKRPHDR